MITKACQDQDHKDCPELTHDDVGCHCACHVQVPADRTPVMESLIGKRVKWADRPHLVVNCNVKENKTGINVTFTLRPLRSDDDNDRG